MSRRNSLPPGKFGLPVIGESIAFGSNPKKFVLERYEKFGPIFKSHVLGSPIVFMVGHEALHYVLSKHREKFSSGHGWPKGLRMLMGGSLLMLDGEQHHRTRRLLSPAFYGHSLEDYIPSIETTMTYYLAKWEATGTFAWYDELKKLTFEIASRLLLGVEFEEEVEQLSNLFATYNKGMEGINPVISIDSPWMPFGRAIQARKKLLEHVATVVSKRAITPTNDALSYLLRAYSEETDSLPLEEIAQHALFLLYAGHESTTSLITTLCMELARHPEMLNQAREEQTLTLQNKPLSFEVIQEMTFLDQLILEVERLYPPFTGGFRYVLESFEFQDYSVPAGWRLFYAITGSHHLSTQYASPETFEPDRFKNLNIQQMRRDSVLAGFGGGPRTCLGMDFARLEIKIIMSYLLRGYKWTILADQRLDLNYLPSVYPKDGLRVSFEPLRTSS